MTLLTDTTIRKYLNRHIIIEPLDEEAITPVGYDLALGPFVYNVNEGREIFSVDGEFKIPPRTTIFALTKELVWVSKYYVAGTFHSKVSFVSKGFSHVSTTLDPGWIGPLLISMTNNTDKPLYIERESKFVTLVFFKTSAPASRPHRRPFGRRDIITNLERQVNRDFIERNRHLFSEEAQKRFEEHVNSIVKSKSYKQVADQIIYLFRRIRINKGLSFFLVIIAAAIVVLPTYFWAQISPYFRNIAYDSGILTIQLLFAVACIGYAFKLWLDNPD